MPLVFLSLAVVALWINLVGAGLVAWRYLEDYPLARVSGPLALGLLCFSLEHFAGWGPRPPLLPATTAASVWLIWKYRSVLQANWSAELLFGAGFFYCFMWRYMFPNIDASGEKMPNLAMIEAYFKGVRLPPPDLWLPPYRLNFYYSFQHYGAALMGRLLDVSPGVSYHLAYCTLVGFIALLSASCFARLCAWPLGRCVGVLSLFLGGSGAVAATHLLFQRAYILDSVRFVGGSIMHARLNTLGMRVGSWMAKPGVEPRDLPMEPLSYIIVNGDYHPPLIGYVLLALAATLIAAQVAGATGRRRSINNALLAATVPLALISNAWIFPLQFLLVGGWFLYSAVTRDSGYLVPALVGAAVAAVLEYPYLVEFTQQTIASNAAISVTEPADHTPWVGWLLTFWPVVGIMLLGFFNRERRSFAVFLIVIWAIELAVTEMFYNHDVYGGVWIRFNSTLKWWPWVYAGIILTLGASNLGSKSALCRYGTLFLLAPTLVFAVDIGVQFERTGKEAAGRMDGSAWVKDPIIRDMIVELAYMPDGIVLESGVQMANTDSPCVALFAGKPCLLGWAWHETTWRGAFADIHERLIQYGVFYAGRMEDPLKWLVLNNVKYVLWMPLDNLGGTSRFRSIDEKVKSRYFWHHMYGGDDRFQVGFWERLDGPQAAGSAPR